MNSSRQIYIFALVILAIALFLPLSETYVSGKAMAQCMADPKCELPTAYAYETIYMGTYISFKEQRMLYSGLYLILILITFVIPFLTLALKPISRAIVTIFASIPALYFFYDLIYPWYMAGAGLFLALLSWIILLLNSLIIVYQQMPHNKLSSIFGIALQLLGGLFLLIIICASVILIYSPRQNTEWVDWATNKDVRFVLDYGGISLNQDYSVVYSYLSPSNFLGHHLDYNCIQLSKFEPAQPDKWSSSAEQNPIFLEALKRAASEGNIKKCFSDNNLVGTDKILSYIWSIHLSGFEIENIEGYKILLFEPKSNRLLYVSSET